MSLSERKTWRGFLPWIMFVSFGSICLHAAEPIAIGVYFNEDRVYCPADEQAFTDLQNQTGRLAKVYLNFQEWTNRWNQFSERLADTALSHGGIFMLSWMPTDKQTTDSSWSCAAIARGDHDAYIRQYAAAVSKWGKPIMIRFAYEMNGHWCTYGTAFGKDGKRQPGDEPADYVAMWHHVWQIFHAAGAKNVLWVWSPNIFTINKQNSAEQSRADLQALYPGDAYVDWIGLDGYNDGVKSEWTSFHDLFDDSYRAITALTNKPLMIAEFGSSEIGAPAGTSKAAWITQAYMVDIPSYPRIRLVNWFDRDKSKEGETDWRFNSSPEALAAYRAAVNSPYYQGEIMLPPKAP